MGVVTPLGVGVNHVWKRLLKGDSGLGPMEGFDASDLACRIAGHVPTGDTKNGDFNVDDWVDRKDQRKMDPFIAFAISAADEAIEDAGWVPQTDEEREKTGVLIGSESADCRVFQRRQLPSTSAARAGQPVLYTCKSHQPCIGSCLDPSRL